MKKIVFITGATSGFGKACAKIFAQHDCDLILTGRRMDRLTELKKELTEKYAVQITTLCFDVQRKKEVDEAFAGLQNNFSQIDLLINNAGLALGRDYFDEAKLEDWEIMLDTNVKGLLYVSKAILPFLKKSSQAQIINLGSTAGKEVYEKGNVYCASKFAVDAISKAMRIDLLRHRIKVTAIHPGAAETEFSLVRFKGDDQQAAKIYDGYQPLSAEDVAEVIYYTASLPPHVCINDLVITCTAQANSYYTFKG